MPRFLFLLLWGTVSIPLFAQKEGFTWYFNKGLGLDFHTQPPTLLHDGAIDTYEGCSALSDSAGNPVLYTDGITLWNKQHRIVEGGLMMGGHSSSTQSGLIVGSPGHPGRYFVFTVDAREHKLLNGLQYAEVDMTAEGGLGRVLYSRRQLAVPTSEKLTGVLHRNGRDVWIVTHGWRDDAFYAYLLTPDGLSSTPVVSRTGSRHDGIPENAIGALKASPDGQWMACAILLAKVVELFHFDPATGQLSHVLSRPFEIGQPYGIEFSPDSRRLYVSTLYTGEIFQMTLDPAEKAQMAGSVQRLRVKEGDQVGALQLAPDGQIYFQVAEGDWLGAIRAPDEAGAGARVDDKAIYLGPGAARFGLPNFVQTYFQPEFLRNGPERARPGPPVVEISVRYKIFNRPDDPDSERIGTLPLEKATVRTDSFSGLTDSAGLTRARIPANRSCRLSVAKDGYFRLGLDVRPDTLPLRVEGADSVYTLTVVLDRIYKNKEINLQHIWYDFDDAAIRPEASPAVAHLAEVLLENPELRVEISSHTDCRGSAAYNLTLSQKRAQSVVNYLVGRGIAAERLSAVGYGESRPVASCVCAQCTEAEHQANRRTTFKIQE